MLVAGLITEQDHPSLLLSSCHFYRTVADLHQHNNFPFVIPPSPGLTYRMLLSPSAVGPSLLCDILFRFKDAFKVLKATAQQQMDMFNDVHETLKLSLDKLSLYNSYILDTCNILWLLKPLPKSLIDGSATRKEGETESSLFSNTTISSGLLEYLKNISNKTIANAFSITHSIAFASLAHSFQEKKNASQLEWDVSLKAEYLEFLESHIGCVGLAKFLRNFISSLALKASK